MIGVAVPTLNSARTLDWTLLALMRQGGAPPRVLVADSGSTDDTLRICERWNVPHIYVPRGNMYRAVNVALRQLNTPWLTYLNSDDIVYPRSYARLIEMGDRTRADVVYGHCDYVDGEGRHLYGHTPAGPEVISGVFRIGIMPFAQPAAIFRREVFEYLGGFDETERTVSDFAFFLKAHTAGLSLARLAAPSVAAFRVHGEQLSQSARHGIADEMARVMATVGIRPSWRDWVDLWRWRIGNTGQVVQRILRIRRVSGSYM